MQAFNLSAGVGVGGLMAGTAPHLAISPRITLSWPLSNGFFVGAHGMVSILVDDKRGVGVYVPLSALVAYKLDSRTLNAGPSVAVFHMPACGAKYCATTGGVAPGLHLQVMQQIASPLAMSLTGDVNWVVGKDSVLAGDILGMVVGSLVIQTGQ